MAEIKHNQGDAGGYLVGNRHSEGGIKAINKSTGQPLEMEGGEVVITRNAVSDPKKRSFNGKMMTNREILSAINESGGGVAFEEGGEVPSSIDYVDMVFEYDGERLDSKKVLEKMASGGEVDDILSSLEEEYPQMPKKFADGGDTLDFSGDWFFDKKDSRLKIRSKPQFLGFDIKQNIDRGFLKQILQLSIDDLKELRDYLGVDSPKWLIDSSNSVVDDLVSYEFLYSLEWVTSNGKTTNRNFSYLPAFLNVLNTSDILNNNSGNSLEISLNCVGRRRVFDGNNIEDVRYTFGLTATLEDFSLVLPYPQLVEQLLLKLYDELEKNNVDAQLANAWLQAFRNHTQLYFRDFGNTEINFETKTLQELFPIKSNFKDLERLAKLAQKNEAEELTLKDNNVFLSTLDYVLVAPVVRCELFFKHSFPKKPNGKVDYPKDFNSIEWWQNNFFNSNNLILQVRLTNNSNVSWTYNLGNPSSKLYECDINFISPSRITKKMVSEVESCLKQAVEDHQTSISKFIFKERGANASYYNVNPKSIQDISLRTYPKEVDFQIIKKSQVDIISTFVEVFPNNFYFNSSTKDIFYLNANWGPLVIEHDLEMAAALKKQIEEEERLRKEQEREEAARLKAIEDEFKNRPFKVRDQDNDLKFFPLEAAKTAFRGEIDALRKLLAFTQGTKMADERAAIIKEITLLEKKDAKLAQKELNLRLGETLLSPENLLSYYYNQATQSPVYPLGEPSGLPTPSGAPSKLPIQAYYAVRTEFFKNWFGDWQMAYETKDYNNCSILVDEDTGEPRIMYHGVRQKRRGLSMGAMGSGVVRPYGEFNPPNFPATYFTDDFNYVKFYAGEAKNQPKPDEQYEGFIYSVFINMRNPVVITSLGLNTSYDELLAHIYLEYGIKVEPSQNLLQMIQGRQDLKVWNYVRYDINLIETLKKAGYDGIIQIGDIPTFDDFGQVGGAMEGSEYLVFESEQVKSATVKNSFYVPFFKDIRFKLGGNVRL